MHLGYPRTMLTKNIENHCSIRAGVEILVYTLPDASFQRGRLEWNTTILRRFVWREWGWDSCEIWSCACGPGPHLQPNCNSDGKLRCRFVRNWWPASSGLDHASKRTYIRDHEAMKLIKVEYMSISIAPKCLPFAEIVKAVWSYTRLFARNCSDWFIQVAIQTLWNACMTLADYLPTGRKATYFGIIQFALVLMNNTNIPLCLHRLCGKSELQKELCSIS